MATMAIAALAALVQQRVLLGGGLVIAVVGAGLASRWYRRRAHPGGAFSRPGLMQAVAAAIAASAGVIVAIAISDTANTGYMPRTTVIVLAVSVASGLALALKRLGRRG